VNVGAQNLRLKQNKTISVVVPFDSASRESLSDPFFLSLIGGIADALTQSGHEMLLSRIDAERLDRAAEAHLTGRSAGVILIGQWHHHDQLNQMAARGLPLAVWGAQLPNQLYLTVGTDNELGGRLAARHLLEQGRRHIVFVGDPSLPEVGQRHAGYLSAHDELGLAADPRLTLATPFFSEEVERSLLSFLASNLPIDGIVAASDLSAMTAISTLSRQGRRVPTDVAVVGYDDIATAAYFHPSLTTIRQPIVEAGRALVELLVAQLAGQRPGAVLLPTELVVRESSVGSVAG
jgi:DNA-binding LacI/PurR family transcriptional regulator